MEGGSAEDDYEEDYQMSDGSMPEEEIGGDMENYKLPTSDKDGAEEMNDNNDSDFEVHEERDV